MPNLRAILSYYSSTVTVNAEGDVHVSDETIEGLGTRRFPRIFFGALRLLFPNSIPYIYRPRGTIIYDAYHAQQQLKASESQPSSFPWDPGPEAAPVVEDVQPHADPADVIKQDRVRLLTVLLPEPGYFLAGGVAGVVSRTATAPLDRLKVYLIAQVGVKDEALKAAKSGAPLQATKKATRPLLDATRQLWRMGGIRSMFAGEHQSCFEHFRTIAQQIR